jgi:hypothetical protein
VARGGGISSDTSNFIIKIVFVILAIVVLYILILRHPRFIVLLKTVAGSRAASELALIDGKLDCVNEEGYMKGSEEEGYVR